MLFNHLNYLQQHHHLFARALHEFYGYELYLAVKTGQGVLETDELVHVFCRENGTFIDANGSHEVRDTLLAPFDCCDAEIEIRKTSTEELGELVDIGVLHPGRDGETRMLIQHFTKHPRAYAVN